MLVMLVALISVVLNPCPVVLVSPAWSGSVTRFSRHLFYSSRHGPCRSFYCVQAVSPKKKESGEEEKREEEKGEK